MAIPSQEELTAAYEAVLEMRVHLRELADLLRVAKNRGMRCNGIEIPLTDDLIQPLIDKYQTVKGQLVGLFQELL
jgi:hypothetical protein